MHRLLVRASTGAAAIVAATGLAVAAVDGPSAVGCDGSFAFRTTSGGTPQTISNIAFVNRDDSDSAVVRGTLADPFSPGTVQVGGETVTIPRSTMGIRVSSAARNSFVTTAKDQLNQDKEVTAFHFEFQLTCDPSIAAATPFQAIIEGATSDVTISVAGTTGSGTFQCLRPPPTSPVFTVSADAVDSPDLSPGVDVFGESAAVQSRGTLVVTNVATGQQCEASPIDRTQ